MTTVREHGTRAKYVKERCRCALCTAANRTAEYRRYQQQALGRQPYSDARRARRHARALLLAGMRLRDIAAASGVNRGMIAKLLYGQPCKGVAPSQRIRPANSAGLLAVPMPSGPSGGRAEIEPTGTRRRLQALVVAGWPKAALARFLGMDPANLYQTMQAATVTAGTDRAVRALYDQMWRADPIVAGVAPHDAGHARAFAQVRGWAPVGAWDEDTIGDPAAHPDWTGKCGTTAGFWQHYEYGITVCRRCRDAQNVYLAERKAQKKAAPLTPVGAQHAH